MLTPLTMIPSWLLDRLATLEARLAPVQAAMDSEAARVEAARAKALNYQRLTLGEQQLILLTAGTDTEKQYWQTVFAAAT